MKRSFYSLLMLALFLSLTACGSKSTAPSPSVSEYETSDDTPDGVQRMHEYHYADTLQAYGKIYRYDIRRTSSDDLPQVRDEEGTVFADNAYVLHIEQGGQAFFSRRFVKSDFDAYLSADFRAKGLLDGMMCDKSLSGITFAVSVSLPQSDMMEPLLLHVNKDGSIAIERDNRAELEL